MDKKPYELGVIVGRFQSLHAGHEEMIRKALALCQQVCVLVGSSQESGTAKNPFSYELREQMLRCVFGEELFIFPLPDIGVGNVSAWGEYVLENVEGHMGKRPDILISAKESRRISWFDEVQGLSLAELYIPKSNPISATQMRRFFLDDDEAAWRAQTNERIWPLYAQMRRQVIASRENLETDSL